MRAARKRSAFVVYMLCALWICVTGCTKEKGLIVLPGAVNVRHLQEYDGGVSYELERTDYPAENVIAHIRDRLRAEGWEERGTDLLNPDVANSFKAGWVRFLKGGTTVFVWHADWTKKGAVVYYDLRYTAAGPTIDVEPMDRLSITAFYYSPETARELATHR